MDEKKQLTISVHPDGTLQHTLNDGFMQLDLGVPRSVERMSDIRHERAINKFYVIGTLDPIKGKYFDRAMLDELNVPLSDIPHITDRRGVLLFDIYEDAVRCEIRAIDAMRIRGDTIGGETEYTQSIDLSPGDYSGTE